MAPALGLLLTDKLTAAKISHNRCNLNSSVIFPEQQSPHEAAPVWCYKRLTTLRNDLSE